jgi:hypothetical protein
MKNAALTLLLSSTLIVSVFDAGAVTVRGARPCGTWIAEKPVGDRSAANKSWTRIVAESWVVGFLSGYAVASNQEFLKGVDSEGLFIWIDNYCQKNPLNHIGDASEELAQELIKRAR